MFQTANVRTTVHNLWRTFVPSAVFFAIYVGIFAILVGSDLFQYAAERLTVAGALVDSSEMQQRLKALGLLTLLPLIAVFMLALLLYLFDRITLGVGNILPPHVFWVGTLLAQVDTGRMYGLWSLVPPPTISNDLDRKDEQSLHDLDIQPWQRLDYLDREAGHLVEQARAENRTRLLAMLDRIEDRFSAASNVTAYSKAALVWTAICAIWGIVNRPSESGMLIVVALVIVLLLLLLWFIGIALMTHWLVELRGERVRIAEAMLRPQIAAPDPGNSWEALVEARVQALSHSPDRIVGLSWGSIEPLQRLRRAFRGIGIDADIYKEYGISRPPKRPPELTVTAYDYEPLFETDRSNLVKVQYIQHGLRLLQAFYDEVKGRIWIEVDGEAVVKKAGLDPDAEDVDEVLSLLRQEGLVEFTPTPANVDAWRITPKGARKVERYRDKARAQGRHPDTGAP
jgi:hypothetical protein